MSIEASIQKFAKKWVQNMKRTVPVRSGKLRDSIKAIDKPEPTVEMLGYGEFVNYGHKTRSGRELGPNPSPDGFIDPAFDKTFKDFEDDFGREVFEEIELAFDKTFK
tara:strand:- start:1813 stop:2133 length:321 start_codon:yes stop_codon:yes gene_type:complete